MLRHAGSVMLVDPAHQAVAEHGEKHMNFQDFGKCVEER